MAMAFLEEEGDEGLFNDVVLAAVDAAVARRLGGIHKQQQNQHHLQISHPPPPLPYVAPQKKLAITHLPSSAAVEDLKPPALFSAIVAPSAANHHHHHQYAAGRKNDVVVVARAAPPISSVNQNQQSVPSTHRDGRMSSGVGKDLKPQGFLKDGGGGIVSSGREGRLGEVKQEEFPMNGSTALAAMRSGRRPLRELQPWVGANQIMERPSSTSTWIEAEKTSCSPKVNEVAWFSGLSGVAMFKECQDAAMRTLVPSDYTVMNGKPFIKKTGWRKIAFFFNLSFEIKDKDIQFDQQANVLRAEFVIRASMPSGRFTDSWGSCDRGEKRFSKPNHDIPSTAETRAKTRACQDLLGIGDYRSDGGH